VQSPGSRREIREERASLALTRQPRQGASCAAAPESTAQGVEFRLHLQPDHPEAPRFVRLFQAVKRDVDLADGRIAIASVKSQTLC
jgi:hypothetical protein